jgi:hypothetical protein
MQAEMVRPHCVPSVIVQFPASNVTACALDCATASRVGFGPMGLCEMNMRIVVGALPLRNASSPTQFAAHGPIVVRIRPTQPAKMRGSSRE